MAGHGLFGRPNGAAAEGDGFGPEQLGLALNRLKRRDEAEAVLTKPIEERGPSSETLGILGCVYKVLAQGYPQNVTLMEIQDRPMSGGQRSFRWSAMQS